MICRAVFLLTVLGVAANAASAATLLYCPFDSLDGWAVRTVGASGASLVERDGAARCLEVTSHRGTVLVSRDLPLDQLRGSRLSIGCSVKVMSDRIRRGPQASSTGKIHLAVKTPRGVEHHYARFVEGVADGKDWHQEGIDAQIPADAQRVVLNLGLESCTGQVRFDDLILRNDRRGVHPIDLTPIINASHEQIGLNVFPKETVQWEGIPFQIVDGAKHRRLDCFRLKGIEHPDWPPSTSVPLPVGKAATAVYILHAAIGGRETSDSPGAIWTAHFVGGHESGFSLFEGTDIGAVNHGAKEELANWKVAFSEKDSEGERVTFGVTKWTIYSNMPIVSISCHAYRGAAPVVLAVTVVEEPPQPIEETPEADDSEDFQ